MKLLLETKQKIKNVIGEYETLFLALFRFVSAWLFFRWINGNTGYMPRITHAYIPPLLALACCLFPAPLTLFVGFVLIVMQCYALGMETAAFMVVLLLLLLIFVIRFGCGSSMVTILTPISFTFGIPVLLPVASGLLSGAASALSAAGGVVIYYFIRFLSGQASVLSSPDVEPVEKIKILADGLILNWGMWITVVAFVLVIVLVNLLRTRSFDYAWHIAIIFGCFVYIVVMITGSNYLNATVDVAYLIVSSGVAALISFVLEFFFYGGQYSRTERLQFEDDDYFYYVKAVPKGAATGQRRSVKRIRSESGQESYKPQRPAAPYANPIFQGDEHGKDDLEKKLEKSLHDL